MSGSESASSASAVPGLVALLGSGETAPAGRRILGMVLARLAEPRSVVVLDSPAGFQPNHRSVAEKVGQFIAEKLGEYHPKTRIVETRREQVGTPEAEAALRAIAEARCIVAGPGSPTYMLRELRDSPYLDAVCAAHRHGAALCVSSAATVALGSHSVPVYEIFKAGEPPEWREGLDLLAPYGLHLVLVPHWNNREGGADVDTSCCYLGAARFAAMREQLPPGTIILGIDEHTGCILDLAADTAMVAGTGGVHILRDGHTLNVPSGESFPLALLRQDGDTTMSAAWTVEVAEPSPDASDTPDGDETATDEPEHAVPAELVDTLVAIRADLRGAKQWAFSDRIRDALLGAGIVIEDTPQGPRWQRREPDDEAN